MRKRVLTTLLTNSFTAKKPRSSKQYPHYTVYSKQYKDCTMRLDPFKSNAKPETIRPF